MAVINSKTRKMPPPNAANRPNLVAAAKDQSMVVDEPEMQLLAKKQVSLSDLPWDTVNIIFDFTPTQALKQFRLNKTFTRLINKRRVGLSFKDKSILPETFGQILRNNQLTLKELRVLVPIKYLKTTLFDSFKYSPKSLRLLDFKKLSIVSE